MSSSCCQACVRAVSGFFRSPAPPRANHSWRIVHLSLLSLWPGPLWVHLVGAGAAPTAAPSPQPASQLFLGSRPKAWQATLCSDQLLQSPQESTYLDLQPPPGEARRCGNASRATAYDDDHVLVMVTSCDGTTKERRCQAGSPPLLCVNWQYRSWTCHLGS